MDLQLTAGQEKARQMVAALLKEEGSVVGILSGYAGTGKSTMLKVITEEHGAPLVLAPTGKAALRVTELTGTDAMTIHRWFKIPKENQQTGDVSYVNKPLDQITLPANHLVVIDEASMVSHDMWFDLRTFCHQLGLKILLVGDPFQLPPVADKDGISFSTLVEIKTKHNVFLTEVCRQALDSPIIRASMMIRQSELGMMEALMGGDLQLVPEDKVLDTFMSFSKTRALIAHRNITRQRLNLEVRERLGHHKLDLVDGEPLLVMHNNYQIDRFNGETVTFNSWERAPDAAIAVRDRAKNLSAMMSFGVAKAEEHQVTLSIEEVFAKVEMPRKSIARAARNHAQYDWEYARGYTPSHLNAELGYCLTAHKAQGSEWDDVQILLEPSVRPYTIEGRRWVYTAITRAKKTASVCLTE